MAVLANSVNEFRSSMKGGIPAAVHVSGKDCAMELGMSGGNTQSIQRGRTSSPGQHFDT